MGLRPHEHPGYRRFGVRRAAGARQQLVVAHCEQRGACAQEVGRVDPCHVLLPDAVSVEEVRGREDGGELRVGLHDGEPLVEEVDADHAACQRIDPDASDDGREPRQLPLPHEGLARPRLGRSLLLGVELLRVDELQRRHRREQQRDAQEDREEGACAVRAHAAGPLAARRVAEPVGVDVRAAVLGAAAAYGAHAAGVAGDQHELWVLLALPLLGPAGARVVRVDVAAEGGVRGRGRGARVRVGCEGEGEVRGEGWGRGLVWCG